MDPASPRSWAQRLVIEPSSNQHSRYSNALEIPFKVEKHVSDITTCSTAVATMTPELEASDSVEESDQERGDSDHDTQTDNEEDPMLVQRYRQLQEDVEVLASHMENQQRIHERERTEMEEKRLTLEQKNAALERELSGLRVETEALYKQSARLTAQRVQDERQDNSARETHQELLHALAQQQQQQQMLLSSIGSADRDRIQARKELDKAQMHCRRLEEELSSAHAQVLHLQNDRNTLKAALDATVTGAAGFEARQLREQDQVIASLRADLVQLEFELKTLSVDKAALEEQVDKLLRPVAVSNFDVVSLGNNSNTNDVVAKRKGQTKRTTIRPVRVSREVNSRRGSDLFNNLMELPNTVSDPPDNANATKAYFSSSKSTQGDSNKGQSHSFRDRLAPPISLTLFMTKTVQSARKHLTNPLHNTFGS